MTDLQNKWYNYIQEILEDFHLDMVDKTGISHEDMKNMMIDIVNKLEV